MLLLDNFQQVPYPPILQSPSRTSVLMVGGRFQRGEGSTSRGEPFPHCLNGSLPVPL